MSITKIKVDFNNILKDQYNQDFYEFNPASVNKIVTVVNDLIKLEPKIVNDFMDLAFNENVFDNLKEVSKEFYQTKVKDILLVSILRDRTEDVELKIISLVGNFVYQLNANGSIVADKEDFDLLIKWILNKKGLDSFIKYNIIQQINGENNNVI